MMRLALIPSFFLVALRPADAQATPEATAFLAPALAKADAKALAQEIESLFGERSTRGRLRHLEDALRPVYTALAGGQGGLTHAAARYVLHRYFQQRHGWSVPGLDPEGGAWNASSPAAILEGRVPAPLRQVFEDRLDRGMDLHELAVLAATFEHLVRIETATRLEAAFRALEIPHWASVTEQNLQDVLEMSMLINYYNDRAEMDPESLQDLASKAQQLVYGWQGTQLFLSDSSRSLAYLERDQTNPFVRRELGFDEVLHVVEETGNGYGMFQDQECQHFKNLLLPHEDRGTGRVPLARFHGLGRAGMVQFAERQEYLRELGVLDESEPGNPMVRIVNWVLSPSNCLGSSALYTYCCVNECNSIMGHLERELGATRVGPGELAATVARHSSSTVAAPRNLSAMMLGRLHEIAASQGGTVAIHGHLFAEWLHHAFPRECPYPHRAGSHRALQSHEWEASSGLSVELRSHELEAVGEYIDPADLLPEALQDLDWEQQVMDNGTEQMIQWSAEEENFVSLESEVEGTAGLAMLWMRVPLVVASAFAAGRLLTQQLGSAGVKATDQPRKYNL